MNIEATAKSDAQALVEAIRSVIPSGGEVVPLHEPVFAGLEWDYLKECLDTGWVSSVGSFVNRFEQALADLCDVRYAVATVNGTSALHVALVAAGITRDDEVLVPGLTFVATANAVSFIGATPHFADSDPLRLGLSPDRLEAYLEEIAELAGEGETGPFYRNRRTGRRLKAAMATHVFGLPVDMDQLARVARRFGLTLIEDAAEALGSRYKGRPAGSLGHVAALSFNGNKIVTTGGGGAVLTNDEGLAKRVRHLSTTAKQAHRWAYEHDMVGFNYRMPNINAALGCAQLERLGGMLARKRHLAVAYRSVISKLRDFSFVDEPGDSESNHWLNTIRLEGNADRKRRDGVLDALHSAGLLCRPVWNLMHRLPMYRDCPRMSMQVAEDLADRLINIPSGSALAHG